MKKQFKLLAFLFIFTFSMSAFVSCDDASLDFADETDETIASDVKAANSFTPYITYSAGYRQDRVCTKYEWTAISGQTCASWDYYGDATASQGATVCPYSGNHGMYWFSTKLVNIGGTVKYKVRKLSSWYEGSNGSRIGTANTNKIKIVKIWLENVTPGYRIRYRVRGVNNEWSGWKYDGAEAYVKNFIGTKVKLKQIAVELIETAPPTTTGINYRVYCTGLGWSQGWKANGQTAGTVLQSRPIEAIIIRLVNKPGFLIKYKAHIQGVGWTGWTTAPQGNVIAGYPGSGLRLEAIQIHYSSLLGYPKNTVQYQAHVQNIGWQEWKYGGAGYSVPQVAGTAGQSLRMEAIRIQEK